MIGDYPLHLIILVFLWGYIYTSWSIMGRLAARTTRSGSGVGPGIRSWD